MRKKWQLNGWHGRFKPTSCNMTKFRVNIANHSTGLNIQQLYSVRFEAAALSFLWQGLNAFCSCQSAWFSNHDHIISWDWTNNSRLPWIHSGMKYFQWLILHYLCSPALLPNNPREIQQRLDAYYQEIFRAFSLLSLVTIWHYSEICGFFIIFWAKCGFITLWCILFGLYLYLAGF